MSLDQLLANFTKYRTNVNFRKFISDVSLSDDDLLIHAIKYSERKRTEIAYWTTYVPTGAYKRATYWPALGMHVADLDTSAFGVKLPHHKAYLDRNELTMWQFEIADVAAGTYTKRGTDTRYERDVFRGASAIEIVYRQVKDVRNFIKYRFTISEGVAELCAHICQDIEVAHYTYYADGKVRSVLIEDLRSGMEERRNAAGDITAILAHGKFTRIRIADAGINRVLDSAAGENLSSTLCYKVTRDNCKYIYRYDCTLCDWQLIKSVRTE